MNELAFDLPDAPAVRVAIRRSEYAVTGKTVAQINAVIDLLGPTRGGRRFGAYTDWEVTWRYASTARGQSYVVSAPRIDVRITVTLPAWTPVASASREVAEAWRRYRSAVERHEGGHKDLAIQAGRSVSDALSALHEYSSRAALSAAAAKAAARALDEVSTLEIDYDRTTAHGARDGARLALPYPDPAENAELNGGAL